MKGGFKDSGERPMSQLTMKLFKEEPCLQTCIKTV